MTLSWLEFDIPAFDTSLQGEIQYSFGRQAVLDKSKKTLGFWAIICISPGHWFSYLLEVNQALIAWSLDTFGSNYILSST